MRIITGFLGLALVSVASTAQAGDLPRRKQTQTYAPAYAAEPTKSWQGCHAGAHLGLGAGRASRVTTSGALIGGQVGCDIQSDRFVAGAELDASYTGMDNRGFGGKFRQKAIGSARVRAGYLVDEKLLAYGTVGLAAGSGQFKDFASSNSKTHVGWVAGVGAQYKVTNNISAKAELLHYDLGRQTYTSGGGPIKLYSKSNVARVGADYHF
jgi:outer membrane immunogenic protein